MDTKRPKTEEELRRQAEKALGRKIPEKVWNTDDVKKATQEAFKNIELGRNQDTTIRDFLDDIQSDLERYKQEKVKQGKREKSLEQSDAVITDFEMKRAKAVAECLAKSLSARKEVRNFREEILEDRFLSPEDADAFVSSLAIGYAKRFDFWSDGISYTQHQTTLVEEKLERSDLIVRYLVEPDNMSTRLPFEARFPIKERKFLDWVNEDLSFWQFGYCKGSLLDETVTLADAIAQETQCDQQVAILFLLTGIAPIVPPIRISADIRRRHGTSYQRNKGSISMMIEPWVSAKSVMKTYQKLQQDLLEHHNRPMQRRNGHWHEIDVFLFVTQRKITIPSKNKNWDDNIVFPTWEELAEAWNRIHPDRLCNRRTLCRDYKRAEQFIMLPSYK